MSEQTTGHPYTLEVEPNPWVMTLGRVPSIRKHDKLIQSSDRALAFEAKARP